jgi:toxin-antitoxin system PIN domain toxin
VDVVDTNVLLHAVNPRAVDHLVAHSWLDDALSGANAVGFAWVALLGFIRVATRPGIFDRALTPDRAVEIVELWLSSGSAHLVQPTSRHSSILGGILRDVGAAGNLTTDAHLAALAVEHHGRVVSFDSDFSRFPGVRWHRPTFGGDS